LEQFDDVLVTGGSGAAVRIAPRACMTQAGSYRLVIADHADAFLTSAAAEGYLTTVRQGETPTVVVLEDPQRSGVGPLLRASASAGAPLLEVTPLSIRIELS